MTETERNQIKGALFKCAEENENKSTLTGHIVVSSLCKSAVERIVELEKENAELRCGVNKWHKVADGDLPDNLRYVWTNVGAGYHDDDDWWDDFGRLHGVVAWCEPEFEADEQLTLPKDILGLWEQTVCEIRSEIKAQDTPALVYAKELCDKLEHSMCAVAGGPYNLRYSITD